MLYFYIFKIKGVIILDSNSGKTPIVQGSKMKRYLSILVGL